MMKTDSKLPCVMIKPFPNQFTILFLPTGLGRISKLEGVMPPPSGMTTGIDAILPSVD